MAELSVADISQLYADSIVLYKDRPARIITVHNDKTVTVLGLYSQRRNRVEFNQKDFKPTLGRIGFINHGGHAFYAFRRPSRRFSIGLTRNNTEVNSICRDMHKIINAYDQVRNMNTKSWAQALFAEYPTFRDAIRIAKETDGSCAFDKQFAVDSSRNIFFKKQLVGTIPVRMSSVKRIQFKPDYQFLEILLENHYDKTVRTFAAA